MAKDKDSDEVEGAAASLSRDTGAVDNVDQLVGEEKKAFKDTLAFMSEFVETVGGRLGDLSIEDRNSFMSLGGKFEGVCSRLGRDKKPDHLQQRNQGAIPKRRSGGSKPGVPDSVESSGGRRSDSSSESSGSSDHSPVRKRRSKFKRSKSSEHQMQGFDFAKMIDAMQSVGTRKTPVMADYDESSGVDFCQYLKDFEVYCNQVIRGQKKFWVNELQARLSGDTLKVFLAAKTTGDSWREIKTKLVQWYQSDAEPRKRKFRRLFAEAKHDNRESLYMLAIRIETLFKMAFPGRSLKMSETLRDKYLSAIPPNALNIFRAQQANRENGGHLISWEKLKSIAGFCDGCSEYSKKSTEDSQEIVIHLGRDESKQPERPNTNYQSRLFKRSDGGTSRGTYNSNMRDVNNDSNVPEREQPRRFSQPPSFLRRPRGRGAPFRPPPAHLRKNSRECYHCGRMGHMIADCRYKNRACFGCGDSSHFIAECRDRNSISGRRNSLPGPSYNGPNRRTRNLSLSQDVASYATNARTDRGRVGSDHRQGNEDSLAQWGDDQGESIRPARE